jgi:hypothetical protein
MFGAKLLRPWILAVVTLSLLGCWNSKAQFQAFLQEGQVRGVPLIIYDISANDPQTLAPETFAVALLNTQDKEISSVKLSVSVCGTKAAATDPKPMDLGGPFEPHTAAILSLMSDPDASGHRNRMMLSHLVITAVTVEDAAGTRKFEGESVATLLDQKIANYCATRGM